jgi:hypothetical protein
MAVTTGNSTENKTQTLGTLRSLTFSDIIYNLPHINVSMGNYLFQLDMLATC